MTLKWIGTRTHEDGVFSPAGLGCAATNDTVGTVGMDLLTRGSLMIEVAVHPMVHPLNLLRFSTLSPWPTGLTVCLEPDGIVRLMMRQGARHLETALKTTLGSDVRTAHITYTWDAPARRGRLSVHIRDQGLLWQTDVIAPFPLSMRDAHLIMTDTHSTRIDAGVTFAAIADAPCPLGPLPGLSGCAAVDTPTGQKALHDIVTGDLVNVVGGEPAPVLWAGHATLPTLGRFAPTTLRRPYMQLWDDLVTTQDQLVCLTGPEVEYLFGEERVTMAARHLETRNCTVPTKPVPAVMTYYQILLETHEIITVNGALVESFDASSVLEAPALIKNSILADVAPDLLPDRIGHAMPVLQHHEAMTLTGVSIG